MLLTQVLTAGHHEIIATYSGGPNDAGSNGSLSFDLQKATTVTQLDLAPHLVTVGEPVTFTASVTPIGLKSDQATAHLRLTGTVTFLEGDTPLQTIPVDATGHAVFTTSALGQGNYVITAAYSGDLNYVGGPSNMVNLVIADKLDSPSVVWLRRYGYHAQPTLLVLAFDQALDPNRAQNVKNYRIVTLGGPGRGGSRVGQVTAVVRAVYDPSRHTVTLFLAGRLDIHNRYRLSVDGTSPTGLESTTGAMLAGTPNGKPGSNYVAVITRSTLAGSSTGMVPLSMAESKRPSRPVRILAVRIRNARVTQAITASAVNVKRLLVERRVDGRRGAATDWRRPAWIAPTPRSQTWCGV